MLTIEAELPVAGLAAIGAIAGLVAGSFLSTLLLRWLDGRSIASGRSTCDGCGRALTPPELVPLVSWLALRGRCRSCRARINPLHAAMEAACAITGACLAAAGMPLLAPLAWLLVTIALFDAIGLWLPDPLVAAIALAAIVAPPLDPGAGLPERFVAGLAGFILLWAVARLFRSATGREGMGGGDPKLFGALALWTGAMALPYLLLGACGIGLAHALFARTMLARHGNQWPFGTYLAAAALVAILAAPSGLTYGL